MTKRRSQWVHNLLVGYDKRKRRIKTIPVPCDEGVVSWSAAMLREDFAEGEQNECWRCAVSYLGPRVSESGQSPHPIEYGETHGNHVYFVDKMTKGGMPKHLVHYQGKVALNGKVRTLRWFLAKYDKAGGKAATIKEVDNGLRPVLLLSPWPQYKARGKEGGRKGGRSGTPGTEHKRRIKGSLKRLLNSGFLLET